VAPEDISNPAKANEVSFVFIMYLVPYLILEIKAKISALYG